MVSKMRKWGFKCGLPMIFAVGGWIWGDVLALPGLFKGLLALGSAAVPTVIIIIAMSGDSEVREAGEDLRDTTNSDT